MDEERRGRMSVVRLGRLAKRLLPLLIASMENRIREADTPRTRTRLAILRHAQTSYADVLRGKYRKHDALLAWAARNLLELWVWSAYVTRSEENLKRFNDDLLFDARDIVAALSLPAPYDPEGAVDAQQTLAALKQLGDEMGIRRFLHVGAVAKEVGLEPVYARYYSVFSKAAHQTASLLLTGPGGHPLRLGLAELFSHIALWEIMKLLASGYPAMDLLPNEKSRVWDVIGML